MGYFVKNQKNREILQNIVYQSLCCFFFPLFEAVMFRVWVLNRRKLKNFLRFLLLSVLLWPYLLLNRLYFANIVLTLVSLIFIL